MERVCVRVTRHTLLDENRTEGDEKHTARAVWRRSAGG